MVLGAEIVERPVLRILLKTSHIVQQRNRRRKRPFRRLQRQRFRQLCHPVADSRSMFFLQADMGLDIGILAIETPDVIAKPLP